MPPANHTSPSSSTSKDGAAKSRRVTEAAKEKAARLSKKNMPVKKEGGSKSKEDAEEGRGSLSPSESEEDGLTFHELVKDAGSKWQRVKDEVRKDEWRRGNDRYAGWPPHPANLEVDRMLDLIEPALRDIFKIKALAKAAKSSYSDVAPTDRFLAQELPAMQAIVKMYEERGEDKLSEYQHYALDLARRAVEELKEMRESDRERKEGGRG